MQTNATMKRDTGSIICSVLLILVAGLFYYDTTTMMDSDSFVFPRAIILMLLFFGFIRVVMDVIAPAEFVRERLNSNYIRSILLVITMLISVSLTPSLGFIFSMLLTFFSVMYLAMYEQWTPTRLWAYPVVAAVVVASLYLLFVHGFNVQFPEGSLWEAI